MVDWNQSMIMLLVSVRLLMVKKITIEPESPGHPDVYDITEAKKNGEIWNDYNSSTKIKAGDYIQDMKYIVKPKWRTDSLLYLFYSKTVFK